MFYKLEAQPIEALSSISPKLRGKIYADIPLSFFKDITALKAYTKHLHNLGVNVILILPHFLPSFSPYVVKNYEQPCELFGNWENFKDYMLFVKELGMDRMIDIPFNHADWSAENLHRNWYIEHEKDGVEAGADDEDADRKRVRINWGAFILDNSLKELQDYWLNKVIFPHIEKFHVNAIRIDAAWGLDSTGLKNIISGVKAKFGSDVWFLAENLGMARLIKLAESALAAGADRFFNNKYWYSSGHYIPSDVYRLYKASKGAPTCSIYSSHDTLFPAMKAYAKLRSRDIAGLNDKGIVRQFVEYEGILSLNQLAKSDSKRVVDLMKQDFTLAALMSSDLMFTAGSERGLFERFSVCASNFTDFERGIESDLPQHMEAILRIKASNAIFNCEGTWIPFGSWQTSAMGLKGFVKSVGEHHLFVAVNSGVEAIKLKLPRRILRHKKAKIYTTNGYQQISMPSEIVLQTNQSLILVTE